MKIVHVCLAGIGVTDGWTYQENLLTKYHKKLGHDVTIITSQWVRNELGGLKIENRSDYYDDNGCKVLRLKIKNNHQQSFRFKKYQDVKKTLIAESPDILFVHNIQFLDIFKIIKYLKDNSKVKVYVDSHTDFSNSASNWLSKNVLHKVIWKFCAKSIEPYTSKFYGVLPARVDFLKNVYKLPPEKTELLVMGADDERVKEAIKKTNENKLREFYSINSDDFLIVTGGKIDNNKVQTLLLMSAVNRLKNSKAKLLIFGSVDLRLSSKFNELLSDNVFHIGWVEPSLVYSYFNIADLIVFPGLHSVFWEQAVGMGKPCVFKYIEGFTHVDLGGNCKFIYEDSVEEIESVLKEIIDNKSIYRNLKEIAENKGISSFSYERISMSCISES